MPLTLFAVLLSLFSILSTAVLASDAAEQSRTEALLSDVITFASGEENGTIDSWINGTLSASPNLNEWYAIGISRLIPNADLSPYADALENYLSNNTVYSATTKQKYGLALIACGKGDSEQLKTLVDETAGKQGIMSYVFALHLLTNGAKSESFTPESIIPVILHLACEGGGWSLTGKTPDPDVTSMTIQALAPYYSGYEQVKTAVDAAILRLSAMQKEDGGFISYGKPNPESAAQVIIALTSLGRNPLTDREFIKNGRTALDAISDFQLTDGSFSHEKNGGYNLAATSQTFLALSALTYAEKSDTTTPFFLFTEAITAFPRLDYSVRDALLANGSSGSGDSNANNNNNTDGNTPDNGLDTVNPPKNNPGAYKLPVCIGIAVLAVAICIVMLLKKRKALSDYLIVGGAALALCLAVIFIDVYTPEQYYGQTVTKENPIGTVTIEIVSDIPIEGKDAVILGKTTVEIEEGETVYDVLTQACRANEIVLDAMSGTATGAAYVRGIDGLHEFDYGDLSGWTYTVNGSSVNAGCDKYPLSDGDVIVWSYTLTTEE